MNDINSLHIMVLILSALIIIMLLMYLFRSRSAGAVTTKKGEKLPVQGPTKPCPLCREPLKPGERVHSVLYPGKPDSLMEIYGCPYCEKETSKNKRICPVCKEEMAADAVVIARVFEKPGKKHVHVLGCSRCYSGRTNIRKK